MPHLAWKLFFIKRPNRNKLEEMLSRLLSEIENSDFINIKNEYKHRKRSLKGQPVSAENTELLTYLQKDIDLAEKVIQLEAELKVAKDEIGYLQAFIQKIVNIGQSDPNVMAIFQRAMRSIEESK